MVLVMALLPLPDFTVKKEVQLLIKSRWARRAAFVEGTSEYGNKQ